VKQCRNLLLLLDLGRELEGLNLDGFRKFEGMKELEKFKELKGSYRT